MTNPATYFTLAIASALAIFTWQPLSRRMMRHRRLKSLFVKKPFMVCRRKTDGTLWMPSAPPHWDYGHALAALIDRKPRFYFLRLHRFRNGYILNRGKVWEFTGYGHFDIIEKDGRKIHAVPADKK